MIRTIVYLAFFYALYGTFAQFFYDVPVACSFLPPRRYLFNSYAWGVITIDKIIAFGIYAFVFISLTYAAGEYFQRLFRE